MKRPRTVQEIVAALQEASEAAARAGDDGLAAEAAALARDFLRLDEQRQREKMARPGHRR